MTTDAEPRERKSHIFVRQTFDRYCEPAWCSRRLFEEEEFKGPIWDPACGTGTILKSARAHGLDAAGSDIDPAMTDVALDFLTCKPSPAATGDIVCNPPFKILREFVLTALALDPGKVAMIAPVRILPAAGKWLCDTPLRRVWMMTPRPSMPSAEHIAAGGKIGGGTVDFCWLVFAGGIGHPEVRWLRRDKAKA